MFFRLGPGDWFKVQSTAGVVRVIGVGKQPIAVDPAEMEAVRKLVAAGVGLEAYSFLGVGDLVEVQGGPIDGFTGILREIRNERTLIISIGLLKRSVAIHLEDGWVTVAKMPQAVRPNPVASLENLDSVRGRRSA